MDSADGYVAIGSIAAAVGSLVTASGLYYLARQTRETNRQGRLAQKLALLAAQDRLSDISLSIDRMFVEWPNLRGFFYEGERVGDLSKQERERVVAAAEFFTDYLENVVVRCSILDSEPALAEASPIDSDAWRDYARTRIALSPTIRDYLAGHVQWYAPEFRELYREALKEQPSHRVDGGS